MNDERNSDTVLKPTRISALSDRVFAIAMTLLVIELSIPVISKLKAEEEIMSFKHKIEELNLEFA